MSDTLNSIKLYNFLFLNPKSEVNRGNITTLQAPARLKDMLIIPNACGMGVKSKFHLIWNDRVTCVHIWVKYSLIKNKQQTNKTVLNPNNSIGYEQYSCGGKSGRWEISNVRLIL